MRRSFSAISAGTYPHTNRATLRIQILTDVHFDHRLPVFYPHQVLAGGSMYAIQLPQMIPAAGTPGGPPLPGAYRYFGGFFAFDPLPVFLNCIRDPQQLQPTMDRLQATIAAAQKKK